MPLSPRNKFIKAYFYKGYSYESIVEFLYVEHGISLCVRQLKRILKSLGLRRRSPLSLAKLNAVKEAISVSLKLI